MKAVQSRSTLVNHTFPAFYACYLLKSAKTAQARATYIGSTPSPPRRIRQHNGELKQGAWKTRQHRPWVMQMIVYGFPSKLAALQFEWAWQHPHRSRHLRNDSGKAVFSRSSSVKSHVQVLRNMVASHPYHTWPLGVKLFTEDAHKAWKDANKALAGSLLPERFTVDIELEGVDGKSGHAGSGRTGPIDVTDESFTLAHLSKASKLQASRRIIRCSVCTEPIKDFRQKPLEYALCPSLGCVSVSHLRCLSRHFLESDTSHSELIPRGGTCKSCNTYTLWGDVIRGCYRRQKGSVVAQSEVDAEEDEESGTGEESDGGSKSSRGTKRRSTSRKLKGKAKAEENDQETFDLNDISSCSESEEGVGIEPPTQVKRGRGRPPKNTIPQGEPGPSKMKKPSVRAKKVVNTKAPKARSCLHTYAPQAEDNSSGEEFFDLNTISSDDEFDGAPPAPSPRRTINSMARAVGMSRAFHAGNSNITHKAESTLNGPGIQDRSAPISTFEIRDSFLSVGGTSFSKLEYAMSNLSVSSPCSSTE